MNKNVWICALKYISKRGECENLKKSIQKWQYKYVKGECVYVRVSECVLPFIICVTIHCISL